MNSLLITGALILNENKQFKGSVLIENEFIRSIIPSGQPLPHADKTIDAKGRLLIPGVIDDQVHFREPGLTHKGDIYSESRAAIAGGITSYMEMPNTNPPAVTQELLEMKYERASVVSLANYSFFMGATNDNIKELIHTNPEKVCGIKVFMGSSTGNMLVDNISTLKSIFSISLLPIAIHSEDENTIRKNTELAKARFGDDVPVYYHPIIRNEEACYRSTCTAVDMAEKYGTRLHILHLSTSNELELLSQGPVLQKKITAEACIHHLWFDHLDYFTHGNLIKWNPSVKSAEHRLALIQAVNEGKIDNIATDHAPHTLREKQNTYFKAPSGGPLVQHALVAMLEMAKKGTIPLERVVSKMCHAPADLFKIDRRGYIREGYYADLVLVDMNDPWTVSRENILYKCGWSPFTGTTFSSRVTHTFVNGSLVFDHGTFHEESRGMRLAFIR